MVVSLFLLVKSTKLCYDKIMKTELVKIHHARSEKDFPDIDLEPEEFVVLHIKRSKIGYIMIWAGEILGFVLLTLVLLFLVADSNQAVSQSVLRLNEAARGYLFLTVFVMYGVLVLSGIIGMTIYKSNHLYITNKRAIQKSRPSLFASSTNIIQLQSIEDVSFRQAGILDYMFRLGTIRMSTMGDETTYTFKYVDTPDDEIKVITHLIHEIKERELVSPSKHSHKKAD